MSYGSNSLAIVTSSYINCTSSKRFKVINKGAYMETAPFLSSKLSLHPSNIKGVVIEHINEHEWCKFFQLKKT